MTLLRDMKYLPRDRARQELGRRLQWFAAGFLIALLAGWAWGWAVGHRDAVLAVQLDRRAALQACSEGERAALFIADERDRSGDRAVCFAGSNRSARP